MDNELKWLAENEESWGGDDEYSLIIKDGGMVDYAAERDEGWFLENFCKPYTKDEWLQARIELGLDQPEVTEAEEEEWQRMEWSKQITDTDDEAQALEDMVNHPPHYQSENGIECIDAIRAALGLDGFVAHCRGTAIKYCWRSGKKQAHAEDLRKAAWYLNEAADVLEEQ